MVYAQILNGIVKNTIVLDDLSLLPLFTEGFDACLRVDELPQPPSIGWLYSDGIFSQPPQPIIEEQE